MTPKAENHPGNIRMILEALIALAGIPEMADKTQTMVEALYDTALALQVPSPTIDQMLKAHAMKNMILPLRDLIATEYYDARTAVGRAMKQFIVGSDFDFGTNFYGSEAYNLITELESAQQQYNWVLKKVGMIVDTLSPVVAYLQDDDTE